MPVTLAARKRHEFIDECLRNTIIKWTKNKLCETVNNKLEDYYGEPMNVASRTILKDLQDMQSAYGAPIDKKGNGNDVSYYYSDHEFSIFDLPLTETEIFMLNEAVFLLKQIKGFAIADELGSIVQRLENKVKDKTANRKSVIAFENAPMAAGTDNLEDIYLAILNNTVLKVAYQSFKQDEPQEWVIHPYFLKEYNNRWYLIGLFDDTRQLGTYALDRIKSVKVTNTPYITNEIFDADNYFKHIIGVTVMINEPIERIVLKFSVSRAPYIITKPLHPSQKVLGNDAEGLVIELNLIINQELKSLIMSFGSDIEVFEPATLRSDIQLCANSIVETYLKEN